MTPRSFGPEFARLNNQYEHSGGEIVRAAYRDSGGVWTGPGGMIRNLNGSAVQQGQTWTKEEALQMYAIGKQAFANELYALVKDGPVLSQHEFDGLGVLFWNIGAARFETSTVLRELLAGRKEDAAAAFGMWKRDTMYGGQPGPNGEEARGPDGEPMPEGVSWFKAFRGLYRRNSAAGLLFSGFDWVQATRNDFIELKKTPIWEPHLTRWRDRVDYQTSWKDILDIARNYPLPDPAPPPPATKPEAVSVEQRPLPPIVPDKDEVGPDYDATAKPKDIRTSETARGMSKKESGAEAIGFGAALTAVLSFVPGIENLTAYLETVSMESILKVAAVVLIIVGAWRMQVGKIMFHHGRKTAKGPKV